MDKKTLIILQTDLNAQLELIKLIDQKLQDRAEGLTPEDTIRLESTAYQIYNLYNAVEDLLKIVATYFENNITDTAHYHTALLRRMTQTIPDIRPALISADAFIILNALRGFRHFFRHAYGTAIEYDQLKINLDKALNLSPLLDRDVNHFLQQLTPT